MGDGENLKTQKVIIFYLETEKVDEKWESLYKFLKLFICTVLFIEFWFVYKLKQEMHQGKHQEYEKGLHDTLIAQTVASSNVSINNGGKSDDKLLNDGNEGPVQNKDAWPCLSVSPDNKDVKSSSKSNKENVLKKSKGEKTKGKKGTQNYNTNGKDNGFNASTDSSEKRIELLEKQKSTMSADEELNLISELENEDLLTDIDGKTETPSLRLILVFCILFFRFWLFCT